ncbi:unnamed protein product [Cylindrotheca closterium]|uniref:RxLR effector protein n=1 Tax=Cylindrotheca closterium TaxID=2856 RepID=A0AAD2G2P5_9STRA|nr:unnamed protein product [Cylindrotheca closterium]
MARIIFTKIILLLSIIMLISSCCSANSSQETVSNMAHNKFQNSGNTKVFHQHTELRENATPMVERTDAADGADRFPELPPDLEAKLRARTLEGNALFRVNRKKARAKAAASANSNLETTRKWKMILGGIDKVTTAKKEEDEEIRTSQHGLRGTRTAGKN